MKEREFVSYIGPPELHDGSILRLEQKGHQLAVFIRDYDGSVWEFAFSGVIEFTANRAQGMVLYALAEFVGVAPLRRFIFVNWDEEGDASLQIVAEDFHVTKVAAMS